MTTSTPSATGSLEKCPLLHLLVSGFERLTSGTLVLETTQGDRSALLLNRGVPVKFKTTGSAERLGAILVDLGWLSESECEPTYELARAAGRLHGEYLAEAGILDADTIARGLRTQMIRKLRWADRLAPTTIYGLYEGADFLSRFAGAGSPVSPLEAIWRLGRDSGHSLFRSSVVSRLSGLTLRLHTESVTEKFGFDTAERALIDVLKVRPETISELAKLQVLPESTLHNMLYVLTLTRQLDLGTGARPLGIGMHFDSVQELPYKRHDQPTAPLVVAARTAPATARRPTENQLHDASGEKPPAATPEAAEKRKLLIELAESEPELDNYQLLGVNSDATPDAIQQAFFRMAKQFHPDRLGPEMADLRETSSRLFARITQAQQTLLDKAKRAGYDAQLAQGHANLDDEQQRVQAVIQAVTSYQKAEVLFKKRMLAAAELEAKQAYEGDPDQADYLALLAWIRANMPDSDAQLPKILEQLNAALRKDEGSEKTHFYRAQVLMRLGRQREALADYRFVVSKNPNHIDAQREIRIWEMRRKARDTLSDEGGFGGRKSSSPAPRASRHPLESKRPARASLKPTSERRQSQESPAPKTGVLGKLFKR